MGKNSLVCGDDDYASVSVRKIDNGWIESRSDENGHTEVHHATKPSISVGKPEAPKSSGSLKKAFAAARR